MDSLKQMLQYPTAQTTIDVSKVLSTPPIPTNTPFFQFSLEVKFFHPNINCLSQFFSLASRLLIELQALGAVCLQSGALSVLPLQIIAFSSCCFLNNLPGLDNQKLQTTSTVPGL